MQPFRLIVHRAAPVWPLWLVVVVAAALLLVAPLCAGQSASIEYADFTSHTLAQLPQFSAVGASGVVDAAVSYRGDEAGNFSFGVSGPAGAGFVLRIPTNVSLQVTGFHVSAVLCTLSSTGRPGYSVTFTAASSQCNYTASWKGTAASPVVDALMVSYFSTSTNPITNATVTSVSVYLVSSTPSTVSSDQTKLLFSDLTSGFSTILPLSAVPAVADSPAYNTDAAASMHFSVGWYGTNSTAFTINLPSLPGLNLSAVSSSPAAKAFCTTPSAGEGTIQFGPATVTACNYTLSWTQPVVGTVIISKVGGSTSGPPYAVTVSISLTTSPTSILFADYTNGISATLPQPLTASTVSSFSINTNYAGTVLFGVDSNGFRGSNGFNFTYSSSLLQTTAKPTPLNNVSLCTPPVTFNLSSPTHCNYSLSWKALLNGSLAIVHTGLVDPSTTNISTIASFSLLFNDSVPNLLVLDYSTRQSVVLGSPGAASVLSDYSSSYAGSRLLGVDADGDPRARYTFTVVTEINNMQITALNNRTVCAATSDSAGRFDSGTQSVSLNGTGVTHCNYSLTWTQPAQVEVVITHLPSGGLNTTNNNTLTYYLATGPLCPALSLPPYWVQSSLSNTLEPGEATQGTSFLITCTQVPSEAVGGYIFSSGVFPVFRVSCPGGGMWSNLPPTTWCTPAYFADPGSLRAVVTSPTSIQETWNPLAVCSPLPPPADNGGWYVVQLLTLPTLTVHCPNGTSLIGPSSSSCVSSNWQPIGSCVVFPPNACRTVTAPSTSVASCAVNELVIGGGGVCSGYDSAVESRPSTSLQAWQFSCYSLVPATVTALCCLADQSTFLSTPVAYTAQLQSAGALTFSSLDSSSFQNCERTTVESGSSVRCPAGKSIVAGGAVCAIGLFLTESYATVNGTWTASCIDGLDLYGGNVPAPVELNLVCCEAFTTPACRYLTVQGSIQAGGIALGENLQAPPGVCGDPAYSLMASGFSASYLITAAYVDSSGGYHVDVQGFECAPTCNTALYNNSLTGLCCPFQAESTAAASNEGFCPLIAPTTANGVGSISSSHVAATNALGATWTLSCPTQYSYLNGSASITCTATRQWSPQSLGSCELINSDQCISLYQPFSFGCVLNTTTISCPDEDNWIMTNAAANCIAGAAAGVSGPSTVVAAQPVSTSSYEGTCGNCLSPSMTATCCPRAAATFLQSCYFNPASLVCQANETAIVGGGACPAGIRSSTALVLAGDSRDQLLNRWQVMCGNGGSPTGGAVSSVCCANPNPEANPTLNAVALNSSIAACTRAASCNDHELLTAASITCPAAPTGIVNSATVSIQGSSLNASTTFDATCLSGGKVIAATVVVTCCKSFDLCHASNIPANLNMAGLTLYWGNGQLLPLSCLPGYEFPGGASNTSIPCDIVDTGVREVELPDCYAKPCPSLSLTARLPGANGVGDGHGFLSSSTGYTGDQVFVQCDPGYGLLSPPNASAVLTCTGNSSSQYPTWQPLNPNLTPYPWCAPVNSPVPQLMVTFTSQYAFDVTWTPFNLSALLPGYNSTSVQWNFTWQLLFPLPSQLSQSNAAEAGITTFGTVVLPVTTTSYSIVVDAYRHIEGTLTALSLFAFIYSALTDASFVYTSQQGEALAQAPCGCNLSDPAAHPFNLTLTQALSADNTLSLTFLPLSLCNPNYQIVSQTALPSGETVLSSNNVSTFFPPLPLLSTFAADNADSCPLISTLYVSAPVATVQWQMTGLVADYCVQAAPQPICTACVPLYIATSAANATELDLTSCVSSQLQWWAELTGTVWAGSANSPSGVANVAITAVLTDVYGVPRLFQDSGGANVTVTSTAMSDVHGDYSLLLQTPYILAENVLVMALTAERVDLVNDDSLTLLSSALELVQLSDTAAAVYDDGSYRQEVAVNTTTITIMADYTCPAPTLTHQLTASPPAASSPYAFCALLYGASSKWVVALSGVISTSATLVGGLNFSTTNGVPEIGAGFPFLALNGTRSYVDLIGPSVVQLNSTFAGVYSTNTSGAGLQYPSQPLLYVYSALDDAYTYTGQAVGINQDQPSPYSHVLDATGVEYNSTQPLLTSAFPALDPASNQSVTSFGLIFDPVVGQYREMVSTLGGPVMAAAPVLSSFTYVPLSSVGSVNALGCSPFLPPPTSVYNSTAVAQLQTSTVAWWTFDGTVQDVTGHAVNTTASAPTSDHPLPVMLSSAVTRYGSASLYLQPTSQFLLFPAVGLFTSSDPSNSSLQTLSSFSIAVWVRLNSSMVGQVDGAQLPLLTTTLGLNADFGFSLTWSVSSASALLYASVPPSTGIVGSISAPLTSAQLNLDVWTHVALCWAVSSPTRGTVTASFYVDGILVANSTVVPSSVTGLALPQASQDCIGGAPGSPSFAGMLDDVILFNASLTALQVAQLAEYGLPTLEMPAIRLGVQSYPSSSSVECTPSQASSINVTATVVTAQNTTVTTRRSTSATPVTVSSYSQTFSSSIQWTQPWNAAALDGAFDLGPLTVTLPASAQSDPFALSDVVPVNLTTVVDVTSSSFSSPAYNLTRVLNNLQLLGLLDPTGTLPAAPYLLDGGQRWISPGADFTQVEQPITLYLPNAALTSSNVLIRGDLLVQAAAQLASLVSAQLVVVNASVLSGNASYLTGNSSALLQPVNTDLPPPINPFTFIAEQGQVDTNVTATSLTVSTFVQESQSEAQGVIGQIEWSSTQLRVYLGSGVNFTALLSDVTVTASIAAGFTGIGEITDSSLPLILSIRSPKVYTPPNTQYAVHPVTSLSNVTLTLLGDEAVILPGTADSIYQAYAQVDSWQSDTAGFSVGLVDRLAVNGSFAHDVVFAPLQQNATGVIKAPFGVTTTANDFIDLSVVTVTGRVTVAPLPNGPAGIEQCGVPNIIVQAFAVTDLQLLAPLYSSLPTGSDGGYAVDVTANQAMVLSASYNGNRSLHAFFPPFLNLTVGSVNLSAQNFADTTTHSLSLQIVGGLCQAPIGQVVPVLVVDSCGSQHFPLEPYTWFPSHYELPAIVAHLVSYTAEPADGSGLRLTPALLAQQPNSRPTPDQLAYQAMINSWLITNGQLDLNLTVSDSAVQLVYTAPTVIGLVEPFNGLANLPCLDQSGTGLTFGILPSAQPLTFLWQLSEVYGVPDDHYNQPLTCGHVNTSLIQLWVHDSLSDDAFNPCVAYGCAVPGTFDPSAGTTTVQYNTMLGQPYPFSRGGLAPPYTRDLKYGIANSVNPEASVVSLLLTGSLSYEGVTSIKIPPSPAAVLMILRDPPGGSSFSSWSSTFSVTSSLAIDMTFNADSKVQVKSVLGEETVATECAGALVEYTCVTSVTEALYGTEVDTEVGASTGSHYEQQTSQTYQLTVSTSTNPQIQDGDGDMLLLISPTVDISLATTVEAAITSSGLPPQACTVHTPYDSPTAAYNSEQQLLWISVWEIKNHQIPEALAVVQGLVEANGGSADFTDPDTAKAYSAALTVQAQWTAILDYNVRLIAAATPWTDTITHVKLDQSLRSTGLGSSDFVQNAPGLAGSAAATTTDLTDSVHLAQKQFIVSFNGASGTVQLDLAGEYSATNQGGIIGGRESVTIPNAVESQLDLIVDVELDVTVSLAETYTTSNRENILTKSQWALHVELADPDIGDQFDVQILQDSMGFPVFSTVSGRSHCRAEVNTVNREQLIVTLPQTTFEHWELSTPVTFTMSLVNASPFDEAFAYQLWHTVNPNGLSFVFDGVDDGFGSNYYLIPPGATQVRVSALATANTGYGPSPVTLLIQGANCSNNDPLIVYTTFASFIVNYDTPCSQSVFAGDLQYSEDLTFTVNGRSTPTTLAHQYLFVISNPNAASGDTWRANAERDPGFSIQVQFKLSSANTAEWTSVTPFLTAPFAPLPAVAAAASSSIESYAFVMDFTGLAQGSYDFRVLNLCTQPMEFTGNPVPLYESISPQAVGLWDDIAPGLVGQPQPFLSKAGGTSAWPLLYPGDLIAATWTEPIDCSSLQLSMWRTDSWASLGSSTAIRYPVPAVWLCGDEQLKVDFDSSQNQAMWAELSGQFVGVSVTGIVDVAGNPQSPDPVVWGWQVLPFNSSDTAYRFTIMQVRSSLAQAQRLLQSDALAEAFHLMGHQAVQEVEVDPHRQAMAAFQQQLAVTQSHGLDARAQALQAVDAQLQREVVRLLDDVEENQLPCSWLSAQVVVVHRREATSSLVTEQLQGIELLLQPLLEVSPLDATRMAERGLYVCTAAEASIRLHDGLLHAASLDTTRYALLSRLELPRATVPTNNSVEWRWASPHPTPPFTFHPVLNATATTR